VVGFPSSGLCLTGVAAMQNAAVAFKSCPAGHGKHRRSGFGLSTLSLFPASSDLDQVLFVCNVFKRSIGLQAGEHFADGAGVPGARPTTLRGWYAVAGEAIGDGPQRCPRVTLGNNARNDFGRQALMADPAARPGHVWQPRLRGCVR
jgi:hypothetical protein